MRTSVSSKPVVVYALYRGSFKLYSSEPLTAATFSPAVKCHIEYLDEGGANILFAIRAAPGHRLPRQLQRKLLRLRKHLAHALAAEDQLRSLNDDFRHLFPPESVIEYEKIDLDFDINGLLNEALQTLVRPRQRAGDFLPAEETAGLLIADMTPQPGEILVQLKPKWLVQSPNAPPDAKRCRTCAMRAHRSSKAIRTGADAQENCPLDLVNFDAEERTKSVSLITSDVPIQNYLTTTAQALFQQLRACQLMFDPDGILKTSGPSSIFDLCKAMTLRDCTLFVRRSDELVEAKIGDLDLKQPEKLSHWKKVEHMLIADGWYTNTEASHAWVRETTCILSR